MMNKTIIVCTALLSITTATCFAMKTYQNLRVANIETQAKLAAYSCNSYGNGVVVCPSPLEKEASYAN
jgi:hypothetical protein